MSKTPRIYFPGLNALRFFAALAVIICHVELIKNGMGVSSAYMSSALVRELGSLGVYFFFVLSGFLITYLLLLEQERSSTVSVKKFYMRRLLRIWPLYLLIVLIGFFLIPFFMKGMTIGYMEANFKTYYIPDLALYLLMLPNVAFAFFTAVPHIGHLWSIGIEEQFYLTWPWLFKKKQVLIFRKLCILLATIILLKAAFIVYYKMQAHTFLLNGLKELIAMSKFENMIIGGMGAVILFEGRARYLKWLHHPFVFYMSLCAIPVIIFLPLGFLQDGVHIVYSVLFLVVIMNVIRLSNEHSLLEKKLISYLGNISYGIYMYHMIVIAMVIYFLKPFLQGQSATITNLLVYPASLLLTVLVAHLSYRYFESYFLGLKNKFS